MRNFWTRVGLGAIGTVYVAMGVVSARVAVLGARDRDAGVPGALRFLLQRPFGSRILAAIVVGVAGLAVARMSEAFSRRRRHPLIRAGIALNALAYAVLAWTAARLLLHLRQSGVPTERAGVAWLLGVPWGATILEIAGIGVLAGGAIEVFQGVVGRMAFRPPTRPRMVARILVAASRFGLVTRGVVLGALGYWLVRAAEELDPDRARGLAGALHGFSRTPFGPAFTVAVAAGLAAYGIHLWTLMLLKPRV